MAEKASINEDEFLGILVNKGIVSFDDGDRYTNVLLTLASEGPDLNFDLRDLSINCKKSTAASVSDIFVYGNRDYRELAKNPVWNIVAGNVARKKGTVFSGKELSGISYPFEGKRFHQGERGLTDINYLSDFVRGIQQSQIDLDGLVRKEAERISIEYVWMEHVKSAREKKAS